MNGELASDLPRKGRKGGFSRSKNADHLTRAIVIIVTILALVYILLPVFWMIKSSFQTPADIRAQPPQWIPSEFTFQAYRDMGMVIPIWRYILNSIYVAAAAAVLSTLVGCSAAYVLARFRFRGMTLCLAMILATQLIPPITRAFPIYSAIQAAGLLNSYTGIIIAYAGFSLPFCVMLLRGYFMNNCPPDLEEAALVDGCTFFSAFWRIILPISLPGLAAVTIFTFLNAWNDFLWASLLLNHGDLKTVQVGIGDFSGEGGNVRYVGMFMAACVTATLPALVMFLFVQRWLVSGLTAGSVK